jgi:uncharacterized membrane protein
MKNKPKLNPSVKLTATLGLAGFITATALETKAAALYTITEISPPPGYSSTYVWGTTPNNRGQVAAYSSNVPENPNGFVGDTAFLWSGPGQMQLLPSLLGATDTIATSINERGQISGDSGAVAYGIAHGVMWDQWGVHDLGMLPGDAGSDATMINNAGEIAGQSYASVDYISTTRAVAWDTSGQIHPLVSVPSWTYSVALAINDAGQLCGQAGPDETGEYPAVLWPDYNSAPIGLEKPVDNGAGYPLAMNNRDQIVGAVYPLSVGNWIPALWQQGRLTELPMLSGDPGGAAVGINSRGQVVGFSGQSLFDFSTPHALLWDDKTVVELQRLLPANSGWVLLQALSINDRGQISGWGTHNGQTRAFVMAPIHGNND